MRKSIYGILLGIVILCCIGCGGGSSSGLSGMTAVTIEFGSRQTAAREGHLAAAKGIPADVVLVKITVTAPDMKTIETTIVPAGDPVSQTLEVPNGLNRRFVIEAFNAEAVALYRGESFANLDGTPATIAVPMVATGNTMPPDFGGPDEVKTLSTVSLLLTWAPGTDSITPADRIQYLIFMSTAPGTQDMSSPSFTVPGGSPVVNGRQSHVINDLKPGTTYYFRVRAMDEQGNVDANTVEKSGTTLPVVTPDPTPDPTGQDTTPPVFAGLETAVANSESVIQLTWKPATDPVTPADQIIYKVYMATQSGGQDFSAPALTTAPGVTAVLVPNLTSGVTYYFVVRAEDMAGNRDANTIERAATPKFIDLLPVKAGTGVNGELIFRVRNNGTQFAYDVETWVLYRLGSTYTYCEPITARSIRPGAWFEFSRWIYSPDYLIIVDPQSRIRETNEMNNEACSGDYCTDPPPIPSDCTFLR